MKNITSLLIALTLLSCEKNDDITKDDNKKKEQLRNIKIVEKFCTTNGEDNTVADNYTVDYIMQVNDIMDLQQTLEINSQDIWQGDLIEPSSLVINKALLYIDKEQSKEVINDDLLRIQFDDITISEGKIKLKTVAKLIPDHNNDKAVTLLSASEKYAVNKNKNINYGHHNNEIHHINLNRKITGNLLISLKYRLKNTEKANITFELKDGTCIDNGLQLNIQGNEKNLINKIEFYLFDADEAKKWHLKSKSITNIANTSEYTLYTDLKTTLADIILSNNLYCKTKRCNTL